MGPRFCAGVVACDGKIAEVAPILCRHIKRGWTGKQAADYCKSKGWTWERVHPVLSGHGARQEPQPQPHASLAPELLRAVGILEARDSAPDLRGDGHAVSRRDAVPLDQKEHQDEETPGVGTRPLQRSRGARRPSQ